MKWEQNTFIDNRIYYNAITFYATIDPVDHRELRFFWQIFIAPLNPNDLIKKIIDKTQLTLASSNYTYSLQEAKQEVQERILRYKISGVGEIKPQ